MKKFINKIKSNKTLSILSILIIGIFFLLITRVTFAFLAPIFNSAQTDVMGASDTVDDFKFELGDPLKIDATPTTLKENGTNYVSSTTAKALLKANSTKNTATYNYYVYFQITSNTFTYSDSSTPEIILTVTNPNGDEITSIEGLTYGTFNGISGFDVTTKNGLFNIADNYEITSNSSTTYTTQEWNITLTYLNLSIDQSINFGNSMGVSVHIRKEEKKLTLADICTGKTLKDCVVAQYTGTQGENSIYYHNSSLANGAGDSSYRYSGPSETTNNFICFGSTTSPCPTDNLYRIIGVIDDKVKLIKYDYANSNLLGEDGAYMVAIAPASSYKGLLTSINVYYWWNKGDNEENTWSTSLLNKINLNTNFINNIGSTWANKIATTTWKVGGNTPANIYSAKPATVYQNEITNPDATNSTDNATEYEAKVGLMYVSDYGFAAMPSDWTITMNNYNNAINNNWMFMGNNEWTITRRSDVSIGAYSLEEHGYVSNITTINFGARPVFNLESSIDYKSGNGSMSDPIIIN